MANYKTQAINLKSYNLSESDKIMVMYSRDYGIIRCVAKGVKKPTSKLGGRMQALMANNLFIAKGKKLDIVCQAELVDSFKESRKDIDKLTYSIFCAELINTFGLENDTHSAQIYDIFFESLKNISLASSTEDVLWNVIRFNLKLLRELGYAVELNNCVRCNADIILNGLLSFCAESGGVVCNSCKYQTKDNIDIDQKVVRTLKSALNFDFPDDDNLMDKLNLYFCFNLLKNYIGVRSHKKLKSPDLIESLC